MEAAFGRYLRELRLARGVSLRDYCLRIQADPSNYSKLERGLLDPPSEPCRLEQMAEALGLPPTGPEARELARLAALSRGMVPPAVLMDRELAGKLPVFFRTIEGEPVGEDQLNEVITMIRKAWTHDPSGTV
jgi:transcriptional regulator with XRE-family HTH domain